MDTFLTLDIDKYKLVVYFQLLWLADVIMLQNVQHALQNLLFPQQTVNDYSFKSPSQS